MYWGGGDTPLDDFESIKNALDSKNFNLLLKGNNYCALNSLKARFSKSVKLIYIDPPYNTGNDSFNYNDRFNHSSWLVFMQNRLKIAKDLLRDDGVIFIQCDDNEQAYLKVLCDEIFGRENFVGTLIHQRAKGGGNAKYIVKGHDYVMIYAKNLSQENRFVREKVVQKKVVEVDGKFFIRDDDVVRKVFGKYDKTLGDRRCFYDELEIYKTPTQITELKEKLKSGELVLEKYNGREIFVKYTEMKNSYSKLYSIIKAMSENATNHLQDLEIDFKNPKPEELLKFIIESTTNENDLILDFFAGSGTTLAVAHKMNRRYIGIEQMDYVESITKERLKKVIAGESGGVSKALNFQGGGSVIYAELLPLNALYKEKIKNADSKNILEIFDEVRQKAFLDYRADFEKDFGDFENLNLEAQKELLLMALDSNMDYLPLDEIRDSKYELDSKTIELNKIFYKKD